MGGDPRPRLWGVWEADTTPDGEGIVALASGDGSRPHFYVFPDPLPEDRPRQARNKRAMCHEIAAYMSGTGRRPPWLDDFVIRRHNAAESLTGSMLVTLGPWVRGPKLGRIWEQETSKQARLNRAKLLRVLLAPGFGNGLR